MLKDRFLELVEKTANGEMEIAELLYKIHQVATACEEEIYKNEGNVSFTKEQIELFKEMFNVVVLLDNDNIKLQAILYALVRTYERTAV